MEIVPIESAYPGFGQLVSQSYLAAAFETIIFFNILIQSYLSTGKNSRVLVILVRTLLRRWRAKKLIFGNEHQLKQVKVPYISYFVVDA